jgi:hypothetical protein
VRRTARGWRETFKFDATEDPGAPLVDAAQFGGSLAFGGPDPDAASFVVIGARREDAAWVYRHIGAGSWSLVGRVDDLDDRGDTDLDVSGVWVAATDDSAILGSPSWTDGDNNGAVYDFDLTCPAP